MLITYPICIVCSASLFLGKGGLVSDTTAASAAWPLHGLYMKPIACQALPLREAERRSHGRGMLQPDMDD